ncbi:MAG TPA: hypothetical protein VNH64_09605, partial [Parvularculaceae bacterium]|nr:hypothetical protein [Parvularculaceae bacterium]
ETAAPAGARVGAQLSSTPEPPRGVAASKAKSDEGRRDANEIVTTIARIEKTRRGHVIFIVEDGSKWMQTDSTELYRTPRAGQSMSMTRSAFSNYLCQFAGSQVFNCAPVEAE